MKKKEKQLKQTQENKAKGRVFTAQHQKAAKLLIEHLRFFVQKKKLEKGQKTRRYTKEELEEIEKQLMERFKQMVEGESDEE